MDDVEAAAGFGQHGAQLFDHAAEVAFAAAVGGVGVVDAGNQCRGLLQRLLSSIDRCGS